MARKLSVKKRNENFFKREEVCLKQVQSTEGGIWFLFGDVGLHFRVVNACNSDMLPLRWPENRDNSDVEIRIETDGHLWLMRNKDVDDLVEWLQKLQRGRKNDE